MPWFDHPTYRPLRDELIRVFRSRAVAFRRLKHVIFLCGGHNSTRRAFLFEFLGRWAKTDALVFQADDVWARIAASTHLNALEMEAQLAVLADAVIVIVESPGTFAELGAFSNSAELRRKLLPILDRQHEHDHSFVNTGPVRWVNRDSLFQPAVFVDLDLILSAADQITARLSRLTPPSRQRVEDLASHPKHLLFFLRDIVAVIGPVTALHVQRYIRAILGVDPPDILSLLGLAQSLRLLESGQVGGAEYYFARMTDDFKPVVRKKFFDLPYERGKVLAALQKIDGARQVLRLLSA